MHTRVVPPLAMALTGCCLVRSCQAVVRCSKRRRASHGVQDGHRGDVELLAGAEESVHGHGDEGRVEAVNGREARGGGVGDGLWDEDGGDGQASDDVTEEVLAHFVGHDGPDERDAVQAKLGDLLLARVELARDVLARAAKGPGRGALHRLEGRGLAVPLEQPLRRRRRRPVRGDRDGVVQFGPVPPPPPPPPPGLRRLRVSIASRRAGATSHCWLRTLSAPGRRWSPCGTWRAPG